MANRSTVSARSPTTRSTPRATLRCSSNNKRNWCLDCKRCTSDCWLPTHGREQLSTRPAATHSPTTSLRHWTCWNPSKTAVVKWSTLRKTSRNCNRSSSLRALDSPNAGVRSARNRNTAMHDQSLTALQHFRSLQYSSQSSTSAHHLRRLQTQAPCQHLDNDNRSHQRIIHRLSNRAHRSPAILNSTKLNGRIPRQAAATTSCDPITR